ncbi:hypothetical protein [Bradyrhizobium paxllaeri]|uniref:hypothetical protein n=1 Tax=Bradyrhizobium paxllaeri TaxID=190148 RepID=UPI000810956E|nr:hypothetical protein [Bradyrhizobium paxllaeri]
MTKEACVSTLQEKTISGGGKLPIEHIHTFLVHPGKGENSPAPIGGTTITPKGKLSDLLNDIYANSDVECDIEISFDHAPDGSQQNDCRDLLIAYLQNPTLARARHIAERLQSSSDRRPGLGLLFVLSGREGRDHKAVISRFPTDSAILAEEQAKSLTIEFLERVFMKSATAYKAAAYQHSSFQTGFWTGRTIDRQSNTRFAPASDYWIFDFLASNFLLTPAAGTRRLGKALRDAAKYAADVNTKSEIAAAVTLAKSLRGRQTSINDFMNQFGLSPEAQNVVMGVLPDPAIAEERFRFDPEEFRNQVAFRSVQLDNGGLLTAESAEFDEVFTREVINARTNEVRYSTSGHIVSERLRKSQ